MPFFTSVYFADISEITMNRVSDYEYDLIGLICGFCGENSTCVGLDLEFWSQVVPLFVNRLDAYELMEIATTAL